MHVIVKRSDESPVYEVIPDGGGKIRVLHRNLLLPCDSLPQENSEATVQPETMTKTKTRRKDRKCLEVVQSDVSENEDFQNSELVLQFPTSLSQCWNPACLNPEAELLMPSVEQCWDRQSLRIKKDRTERAPEEQTEEDTGMPAEQSGESEEQTSVESDDDDSIPVNSYPMRDCRRTKILTYESLGHPSVVEVAMDRLNVSTETSVQRLATVDSFGGNQLN